MLVALFLVSFVEASVLSYIIVRSRWNGWKLILAIFWGFYGLHTVMAQIESAIYLPQHLPPGMIPKLFVMGAIVAGLFSPVAVLILGKLKRESAIKPKNVRLVMPPGEWAWKLAAICIAYVVLYYGFGYFVAWKNPTVQAYYGGTDPGDFLTQLAGIWAATPWMYPFQMLRGLMWTAFALPIIRMHRGTSWEVSLAVGLLFAVWSSQLLLPNPFMPREVATAHFVETAPENFIFGWLVGWLLSKPHPSFGSLFQLSTR